VLIFFLDIGKEQSYGIARPASLLAMALLEPLFLAIMALLRESSLAGLNHCRERSALPLPEHIPAIVSGCKLCPGSGDVAASCGSRVANNITYFFPPEKLNH